MRKLRRVGLSPFHEAIEPGRGWPWAIPGQRAGPSEAYADTGSSTASASAGRDLAGAFSSN